MNLRTLNYLAVLAEEQHFGRAAKRCFVSQPTLSAQIRKLEEELGVVLIERGPGKFLLTDVGREILKHAQTMLDQAQTIEQISLQQQNPLAGTVTLGFIPTLGPYLMPHILKPLKKALPDISWQLAEYQTDSLLAQLLEGKIDVGLLALPCKSSDDSALEHRELFTEPFVVTMPPNHELTAKKTVAVSDLSDQCLLLLEDGHCLRDQALAVCSMSAHPEASDFKATSFETLRQMVATGLGITLMPQLAVSGAPANLPIDAVAVRPFKKPVPFRTIGAVWRAANVKSQVIGSICDTVSTIMTRQIKKGMSK